MIVWIMGELVNSFTSFGLKLREQMLTRFVCLCWLAVWSPAVMAQPIVEPRFFVFPRAGHCSVMLDVSPLGTDYLQASQTEQATEALRYWFTIQKREYSEKCPESVSIKLLVVRITAVDKYGRPDFANRVNLFELSGEPELFALARNILDGQNPKCRHFRMSLGVSNRSECAEHETAVARDRRKQSSRYRNQCWRM